jgi:hypothetical protein
MDHYNNLTPAEDERLTILIEECGEVIQAACKIQRHGYVGRYETGEGNRFALECELGDVRHILDRMLAAGDVD